MMKPAVDVSGEVSLTVMEGQIYRVSGHIDTNGSAVWIEDADGKIVSTVLARAPKGEVQRLSAGEYANPPPSADTRDRRERFANLQESDCEPLVQYLLGQPDSIEKDTWHYADLGDVRFFGRLGSRHVHTIRPEASTTVNPEDLAHQLQHDSGDSLRYLGKAYALSGLTDTVTLDVIAQHVWNRRETPDSTEADALAYLCKALGNSGNPRYRAVLAQIAEQGGHARLRRHAKGALSQLPANETSSFEPKPPEPVR